MFSLLLFGNTAVTHTVPVDAQVIISIPLVTLQYAHCCSSYIVRMFKLIQCKKKKFVNKVTSIPPIYRK